MLALGIEAEDNESIQFSTYLLNLFAPAGLRVRPKMDHINR